MDGWPWQATTSGRVLEEALHRDPGQDGKGGNSGPKRLDELSLRPGAFRKGTYGPPPGLLPPTDVSIEWRATHGPNGITSGFPDSVRLPGEAPRSHRRSPPGLSPVLERNIRSLQRTPPAGGGEATSRSGSPRRSPASRAACCSSTSTSRSSASGSSPIWAGCPACRLGPVLRGARHVASVEAIFLSTFVLISQNRMAAAADKRADLDLQISLLAEHEVTKLVNFGLGHGGPHGRPADVDAELDEIKQDVAPEAVLDEIEETEPERR